MALDNNSIPVGNISHLLNDHEDHEVHTSPYAILFIFAMCTVGGKRSSFVLFVTWYEVRVSFHISCFAAVLYIDNDIYSDDRNFREFVFIQQSLRNVTYFKCLKICCLFCSHNSTSNERMANSLHRGTDSSGGLFWGHLGVFSRGTKVSCSWLLISY